MAFLKEITEYKKWLMTTFSESQNIVNLLLNTGGNVNNFRNYVIPNNDVKFENIYPYAYVPEETRTASSFICYDIKVPKVQSKTQKKVNLYFYIFSEQSLMKCNQGTRIDLIAENIDMIMNGTMDIGIGRMELVDVDTLNPIRGYYGRTLTYTTNEWNRLIIDGKPVV